MGLGKDGLADGLLSRGLPSAETVLAGYVLLLPPLLLPPSRPLARLLAPAVVQTLGRGLVFDVVSGRGDSRRLDYFLVGWSTI